MGITAEPAWTPMKGARMALCAGLTLALVTGCGPTALPDLGAQDASAQNTLTDVEAPDVFAVTAEAAWDGRPSLGGVWVAHKDVTAPERVILRDTVNGTSTIGSLFRKDKDTAGPPLQLSLDAAAALGLEANETTMLSVVALRRGPAPSETPQEVASLNTPTAINQTSLEPATAPSETKPATPLPEKPYVQIGIFHVKANATRAARQMRAAGATPLVKEGTLNDKAFWRVVIGPAPDDAALSALRNKATAAGFTDAYAVTD